ncbi:MAG: hypothetical protein WA208_07835 [Thermoanaerobaculia bacterium]
MHISRNARFLLLTIFLVVAAGYSGTAAAFFSWITADPPVAVANGRSRPHTTAELEFARHWATVWFGVFVAAVCTIGFTIASWWRGRPRPVV